MKIKIGIYFCPNFFLPDDDDDLNCLAVVTYSTLPKKKTVLYVMPWSFIQSPVTSCFELE